MADQNPMAHSATPADEDLQDQALVLDRLLVHWPTHLQEVDLQRELQLGEDDFDYRDRVDRAVVQLHWAGLALRSGPVVIPTRAALHYHLLSDGTTVDL
jgi:hypothetical protein